MPAGKTPAQNYASACRTLAYAFWKRYYHDPEDGDALAAWNRYEKDNCVGGDPTGVWCFGDEFWGIHDMFTALLHDADPDKLRDWYWASVEAHGKEDFFPNLENYLKGAPVA